MARLVIIQQSIWTLNLKTTEAVSRDRTIKRIKTNYKSALWDYFVIMRSNYEWA